MTRVLTIAAVALSFAARADEAIVMGHTRAADGGALRCLLGVARASGLEVEERILSTDATLVDALGSGEVDVAVGDAEAAIAAWARGLPVVVVAGFAPSHARIVARRALEAVRVADLVHRRIGVPRGGSLELLLLGELHAASLGWSDGRGGDVQLVHLAPADLGPALRSGYVDAIVQSEPEASLAIRAGDGVEVPRTTGDRPAVLLATGRAYAERRRLAALVRSLVDAARLAERHQDLAARDARAGALEQALWIEGLREPLARTELGYAIRPEDMDETARRMAALGVGGIGAVRPAGELVRLDLLAEAAGEADPR